MSSIGFAVSANRRSTRRWRPLRLYGTFSAFLVLFVLLGTAAAQDLPAGTSSQKNTANRLLNYLQAKQIEQAISLGQQAVERWPQNADFHHWLGIAYFQSGKNTEALRELAGAAKLRPEEYDIHFDTALVHLQERQYAAAAEQLQKALRLKPGQPMAHLLLGRAYQNSNRSLQHSLASGGTTTRSTMA